MIENSNPDDALTQFEGFTETATFCRLNDDHRPGHMAYPQAAGVTQVCPDDLSMGAEEVTIADPLSWFVRVEFDRLLDPNIEELTENDNPDGTPTGTFSGTLKNTQPVTLTCGGTAIAYDGYYSPAGNNVAWPLGPGIFVQPNDSSTIATGIECEISMKPVITGKTGEAVATDSVGPFKFKVDVLKIAATSIDPSADLTMPDEVDATAPIVIGFNALIDDTSIPPTEVTLETMAGPDCSTGTATAAVAAVALDADDATAVDIIDAAGGAAAAFVAGTTYRLSFTATATAKDVNGGMNTLPGAADLTFCFTAM